MKRIEMKDKIADVIRDSIDDLPFEQAEKILCMLEKEGMLPPLALKTNDKMNFPVNEWEPENEVK